MIERNIFSGDDMDRVFRSAIDGSEIEPSEAFWAKSEQFIIKREEVSLKKSLLKWKGITAILGLAIILAISYIFVHHSHHVTKVQNEMASVQEPALKADKLGFQPTISFQIREPAPVSSNSSNRSVKTKKAEETGVAKTSDSEIITSINSVGPVSIMEQTMELNLRDADRSLDYLKLLTASVTPMVFAVPPVYLPEVIDTTNLANHNYLILPVNQTLSRLYISAFYSHRIRENYMDDNNPFDDLNVNDIKKREIEHKVNTYAVMLGYDINSKFSLQTGFQYDVSNFIIASIPLHATRLPEGQLGYQVVTSAGTVDLDYQEKVNPGDSLIVNGHSHRNYFRIPVQAKYDFARIHRFSFYATGGAAFSMITKKESTFDWTNSAMQTGEITETSVDGLDSHYFSYIAGAGIQYRLEKYLSVFCQPYIEGTFTHINTKSSFKSKPIFWGVGLGLNWNF